MISDFDRAQSRRGFIRNVGSLGATAAALAVAAPAALGAEQVSHGRDISGDWDLSWVSKISGGSDRAVFDAPEMSGGLVVEAVTHFLNDCDAVYGAGRHTARPVLVLRARAIAIGLDDTAWERYKLGSEYDVQDPNTPYFPDDPATFKPALKNPYLRADRRPAGTGSVEGLAGRGVIVLVCDAALGRLASRVARGAHRTAQQAHDELRAAMVPGSIAVPSGAFALMKSQNEGCALVPFPV